MIVAGRLGHQTADTGQLAELVAVAERAGVHHERNLVVFLLPGCGRALRNMTSQSGRAMRPDIDDLLVTFAGGGDDTLRYCFFDVGDLLLRRRDFLVFPRDDSLSSMPMATHASVASRNQAP